MNEKDIIEYSKLVYEKAEKLFGRSFPTPTIKCDITKERLYGTATGTRLLRFNPRIAAHLGRKFEDVVIHEIAHLIQEVMFPRAPQAHGPEFRMIAKALGGSGDTKAKFDISAIVSEKRKKDHWVYKCDCKEYFAKKLIHSRIVSGQRGIGRCKSCYSIPSFTNLIVQR